jgi:hypothetical protein
MGNKMAVGSEGFIALSSNKREIGERGEALKYGIQAGSV